MNEEINGVHSNIQDIKDKIKECSNSFKLLSERLQLNYLSFSQAFTRWKNLWPILHIWLYSESNEISSINASSELRGLDTELKELTEMSKSIKVY